MERIIQRLRNLGRQRRVTPEPQQVQSLPQREERPSALSLLRRAQERVREVDEGRRPRPDGWEGMTNSQRLDAVDPEYGENHHRFLRSLSNVVGFK
ncbi:MAG TPA: hypothetical protein VF189_02830 [Patescibacteria group bacterium]